MTRMNAGIILAGQTPDIAGSVARGVQNAGMINAVKDQNALRGLYADQGANIMAGDQNALNSLAGLNPQAALGIQQTQQAMEQVRARARRAAESQAASLSAAEAAAEAQKLEAAMNAALMAPDEASYNAVIQGYGLNPAELPFAQRDMHAARVMGALDVLKIRATQAEMEAGPKPADEYGRYAAEEAAAGREPLSRIDYAQAKRGAATVVYDPETGNPIASVGGAAGGAPPKLTVDAGKNTGFYMRTLEANEVLNGLEGEGTDFWQQAAGSAPLGVGNYMRTPEFQKFDQARRDFVNAILRRESGAVISDQEFENANQQYFPVPGDSPEVIEQKRRNRETAIAGLRVGSGAGATYVDGMQEAPPEQGGIKPGVDFDPGLLEYMTPEERALFE